MLLHHWKGAESKGVNHETTDICRVNDSGFGNSICDLRNRMGPHAGDMNNFVVRANGTARVTITDPRVNLGSNSYSIFAAGGTALVIHAKGDDMKTDPSGNSGDRIACGVIAK